MDSRKTIAVLASSKSFIDSRQHLIKSLIESGHKVCCIVPDHFATNPMVDFGAEFYGLPLEKSGFNPLKDLRFLLKLVGLFRNLRPDMVLAYTIKPVIYGSIAAKIVRIPHIFSVIAGLGYAFINDSMKQKLTGLLAKKLYKIALKFNDKVFFQNPDDLNDFLKLGIVKSPQSILINGSGVDLSYFSHSPPTNTIPGFVMISRMLREKGVIEFIEAARVIKREFPSAIFKVIGPTDSGPSGFSAGEIEGYARENSVEYHGKTEDVRPFLREASVYVLPSYYREGVPRTILEALSTGRAIITTDTPGCRETVEDGKNGFLVPSKNIDALVEAMRKLILDPALANRMGRESRKLAEKKFDVHGVNRMMLIHLGLI